MVPFNAIVSAISVTGPVVPGATAALLSIVMPTPEPAPVPVTMIGPEVPEWIPAGQVSRQLRNTPLLLPVAVPVTETVPTPPDVIVPLRKVWTPMPPEPPVPLTVTVPGPPD